jgi:deoxyinosine 3'endonuclease (endonuclease V)
VKQAITHPWALSETEARVETVAGVDVAYYQHSNKLIAAVVVLNASTFEIVASATAGDE